MRYYFLIHSSLQLFTKYLIDILYKGKNSFLGGAGLYIAFSCHVSLSLLNSSLLFPYVLPRDISKSTLCKMFLNLGVCDVFSLQDWICAFFGRNTTEALLYSSHNHIRRYISIVCPYQYQDPLVKAVSARYLHREIILFHFVMNKYFVGRYFENM